MRTAAIGLITALALCAPAATHAESLKARQQHQEQRIEHGADSGRLTPRETERLQNEEQTIRDERQRALEDGKMTRGERHDIRHDEKAASRDIRRKAHNDRGRQ